MNNSQKFIKSEFEYIKGLNMLESQKQFKPSIVINLGVSKTKHISITWEQFEHIKQYLVDSAEDK